PTAACPRARRLLGPLPQPIRRNPETMRPSLLDPLFAALTGLPGIGPKLAKLFARLLDREAPRLIDLLFHLPSGTIDRRARPKLRDVVPDTIATVLVTVDRHKPPPPNRPRAPYQIYASDEPGDVTPAD